MSPLSIDHEKNMPPWYFTQNLEMLAIWREKKIEFFIHKSKKLPISFFVAKLNYA